MITQWYQTSTTVLAMALLAAVAASAQGQLPDSYDMSATWGNCNDASQSDCNQVYDQTTFPQMVSIEDGVFNFPEYRHGVARTERFGSGQSLLENITGVSGTLPHGNDMTGRWEMNPLVTFTRTDQADNGTVDVALNIWYKQNEDHFFQVNRPFDPNVDADTLDVASTFSIVGSGDTSITELSDGTGAWKQATTPFVTMDLDQAEQLQLVVTHSMDITGDAYNQDAGSGFAWRLADTPFTFSGPGTYTANSAVLNVSDNHYASPDLKITEIYAGLDSEDGTEDWIEITNLGDAAGSVAGLQLDDESNASLVPLTDATLQPGESVVVLIDVEDQTPAEAIAEFESIWGTGINVIVSATNMALSQGSLGDPNKETIRLLDIGDTVTDVMSYDGVGPSTFNTLEDPDGTLFKPTDSILGLNGAYESNPFYNSAVDGMVTLIGSPGVVPEPAALGLMGIGGLTLLRRRWR